ncbi:MAG: alanine racemase [Armatimonadetes bacterium]|nr:alanine racemase [Armatimonadota bacterium]
MQIADFETPVLLVDLDRLERNLSAAAEYARSHEIALTPHIKTHKSVEIARRQIAEGAAGLTCAKLGEAELMADAGFTDLLLAYPLVGEPKLKRLTALARRATVTVALDSIEVAAGIAEAAERDGVTVGILAEVDTGTRRCGLPPGPELVSLCRFLMGRKGLEYRGLMTYQGHLQGTAEGRAPLLADEADRLSDLYALLEREGIPFPIVSAGSTPNQWEMHRLPGITHVRHGTYVFNDRNTLVMEACAPEECALAVAVTVVSTSIPGQIVIDGGSKTFSYDRLALGGEGFGLCVENPSLVLSIMNEEHGYVDVSQSERRYRVGDRLHFIPNHVCTCVNLHDTFAVHRDGQVEGVWAVDARGRVQ